MVKILLIESNLELMDKLGFILESISGAQVEKAQTISKAQEIFDASKEEINLLVVDLDNSPHPDLKEFQKKTALIKCILCSPLEANIENTGWNVIDTIDPKNLISTLKKCVETHFPTTSQQYCRIKTSLLIDVSPLRADVYAKLSETKYLKIMREGDEFDLNDLKKYAEQKKLEYLYLRSDQCSEFIQKFAAMIGEIMQSTPAPTYEQVAVLHTKAHETVQELTDKLGFTPEVQALAKTQVQSTVQFMNKKPSLNKVLSQLQNQKGKYIADHSFLLSYISCSIASQLTWGSESTFFKLSLASFMHDITVKDEKLAECATIEDAKKMGLSGAELMRFKNHPSSAAEYVKNMSEIPADVDSIILHHHEQPDGSGFPRQIGASYMSPLAAIFIIAHDVTRSFFQDPDHFSMQNFAQANKDKYAHSNFRKILEVVKNLTM